MDRYYLQWRKEFESAYTLNKKSWRRTFYDPAASKVAVSMRFKRDGRRCHAACRVRFSAASAARLSSVAHPLDANVAHWSLGILSRKIHERTVCGETEQIEATVSGVPAFFTMVA